MRARVAPGCLIFLLVVRLDGQTGYADSLYAQAGRHYRATDYSLAANVYDRIIRQGYAHVDLFYNLGNAYYQLGRLGEAIWAYEKGLRLEPRDPDLKFNLRIARARTVDRVERPEPFFLLKWYMGVRNRLVPGEWLALMSFLFFLSGFAYLVSRVMRKRARSATLRLVVILLMLTTLSGLVFADVYLEVSEKRQAIVVAGEGRVFSAPVETGNLLFVVHEGTKAKITGEQGGWTEIELIDGKKGWILEETLKRL